MRRNLGLWLAAGLLAAGTTAAAGAEWRAVDQPDLAREIEKAPPLSVEKLMVPIRTTRLGETMLVPNPGKPDYDVLQWYWPEYAGPSELVILDLSTNEIARAQIARGRQLHLCGRALAPNGKLYIAMPD